MRLAVILFPAGILILFSAVIHAAEKSEPPGEAVRDLVVSSNAFAFDFYKQRAAESGNLVVSPYSLSAALAMVWAGTAGETASEIQKGLRLQGTVAAVMDGYPKLGRLLTRENPREARLDVAQALWPQKGHPVLAAYLDLMRTSFNAAIVPVDYRDDPEAARKEINQWVGNQTRGRIKNVIPPDLIQQGTRLLLVNTIYFKGQWRHAFLTKATEPAPFTTAKGEKLSVSMMHSVLEAVPYTEADDLQILELPYSGGSESGQMVMDLILPQDEKGFESLKQRLTQEQFQAWCEKLKKKSVNLSLPRFRIENSLPAKETLTAMGMSRMFAEGQADFSGVDGGAGKLYLSDVLQQVSIDVDEFGAEATAASVAAEVVYSFDASPMPVPEEFNVDRPFLFVLRDLKTGLILFMGRVADPRS